MSDVDVSEEDLRAAAESLLDVTVAPNPTKADLQRARDYLRASELARAWLKDCDPAEAQRLTPFRCFILGYLAAVKDRV